MSKNSPKVRLLKKYLLESPDRLKTTHDLAAIATHRALVYAWRSFSDDERRRALRRLTLRIDEGHHMSNVFLQHELEELDIDEAALSDDGTELGSIARFAMNQHDETFKINVTTATFFRGDGRTILSPEILASFEQHYLPWDQHFQTLGIESLTTEFVIYETDPIQELIEAIKAEPGEHHLIILPQLTRSFRREDTLCRLKGALTGIVQPNAILDLVTRDLQKTNKTFLYSNPDDYNVVIACRLFDEGTDWLPCTRLHNTDACESSLTLAVQRFFRPLRKHPQKKVVRILNYLPRFVPEMHIEEQRRLLSNRTNAILAAIVTQGELVPCRIPRKAKPDKQDDLPNQLELDTNDNPILPQPQPEMTLGEVYGIEYHSLLRDLIEEYEALPNKEDAHAVDLTIGKVIEKFGIPDSVDEQDVRRALQRQVLITSNPRYLTVDSISLATEGIDVDSIRSKGFDVIWQMATRLPSVLLFGSENLNIDCVRRLMGIVNSVPSLEQIHEGIRAYHSRTGSRPTFHQPEPIEELNRSASAVDKLLRRNHESTLAKTVITVLGSRNDDLLERTRKLIRDYWARGIRIGNKYGDLPEFGITSIALNGRLITHYQTTLAKEVEAILGTQTIPLTLPRVREVIGDYLLKGIRLSRKFGWIAELGTSSFNLAPRLESNFGVRLLSLVNSVETQLIKEGQLSSPVKRRSRQRIT